MSKQACLLKNVPQRTLVYRDKHVVAGILPDFIIDLYEGLAGTFQAGDTAQAGGFPRAGVPVKRCHPLARQLQVQVQGKPGITVLQAQRDRCRHVQLQLV